MDCSGSRVISANVAGRNLKIHQRRVVVPEQPVLETGCGPVEGRNIGAPRWAAIDRRVRNNIIDKIVRREVVCIIDRVEVPAGFQLLEVV
jgi:hypothetical protein